MAGADKTATFALELDTKALKGPAADAANALQALRDKITADTKALGQMQAAMRQMQGGTVVNVAAFKQLREKIAATKSSLAQSQSQFVALGGSFHETAKATSKATDATKEAKKGFGAFFDKVKEGNGPLAALAGSGESLAGVFGGGVLVAGFAALAAAIAAVAAAAIVGAGAIAKFGISVANARRDELLLLQGMTKVRNYWGVAAGSATEVQAAIDSVSASSALGRDQIAGYAQQLYRTNLRGAALKQALEGVATVASTQGEAQASLFASQVAWASRSGVAVKKLADDVKARLGGVAKAQMLSLGVQSQKLHESFAALFTDLKIEPLLGALHTITDMFSQNSAGGRALRVIVNTIFQPMIDSLKFLGPVAKRFFQGLIIGALMLAIGIVRLKKWFDHTFGDTSLFNNIDLMSAALLAGKIAAAMFAGALTVTALVLGVLAAAILLPIAAIYGLWQAMKAAYTAIVDFDYSGAGKALVDGIVNGIKNGAGALVDAVKGLGKTAYDSFMKSIDAHSPSKLFMRAGFTMPAGATIGVNTGAPMVRQSVEDMLIGAANPPSTARLGAGLAAGFGDSLRVEAPQMQAGARVSNTTNNGAPMIGELHVHANDAKQAPAIAEAIEHELARVLAGVAVRMGANVVGAL